MDILSSLDEVQLWFVTINTKIFISLCWNYIVCISEAKVLSIGNSWAQVGVWQYIQIYPPVVKNLLYFSLWCMYVCVPSQTNTHKFMCVCAYAMSVSLHVHVGVWDTSKLS